MIRRATTIFVVKGADRKCGFTLIEAAIVLAVIGIMSTIAAVYISSSDTELRKFVLNLRFDMEGAKLQALTRNAMVHVSSSFTSAGLDCNGDTLVNEQDRCYVIYQDLDGNGQYTPGLDPPEEIKKESVDPSLSFVDLEGAGDVWFSPLGESQNRNIEIRAAIRSDSDLCSDRCIVYAYPFAISGVGRISVGEKTETHADCTVCSACGECL